ncbi:RNA polymerase factor sigma-54 [Empedobacter sp. 225-1]|uniref:RNA polymerase factor sigma-54 n=1 Tax=unclassified Empedobacter TaxID=2643773 RepID=UPI002578DB6A|nr:MULTISPECIES: RNA polymerase factor sigma-54 [unclassified Empedobacter]MDM1522722.1 RNA polymerase factor sigma-54 [Empedobacter sp. 225-1]MDM1542308.1 RNA polymerase factor sigma-54 [Empedobacter sp. 189-2]
MLKQELNLKLQQKLSPQQIQLMKLVQLPTVAFEQRVKEELEENPALDDQSSEYDDDYGGEQEEWDNQNDEYGDEQVIDTSDINIDDYLSDDDVPNYKTYTNNYSDDDEDKSVPYAQGESFIDFLTSQLYTYRLTSEQFQIGEFILGNIDDDGYMRRDIKSLVDDLAFSLNIYTSPEEVENLLLNYIQRMDPIGVGARDLQECLLIQLENKTQTQAVELAEKLINESFDAFTKKHYSKLMAKYDVDDNELRDAITEIERLNPKPGKSFSSSSKIIEQITPDFTININDGDLELTLNGRNVPELKISSAFAEMLDTYKKTENKSTQQKEAVMFVKQKLDSAKWFIDAVQQRRNTLLYTMEAIMKFQKEYFLTGDETKIKPMILKDISDRIGMDISTVSRVANSKYVTTPYGTFLIKDLFSESLTNDDGEEVSTREIKRILQDVIADEDKRKPLTDEKLTEILKEKGYPIARRTIAKYREQLNIPVARLRKEI